MRRSKKILGRRLAGTVVLAVAACLGSACAQAEDSGDTWVGPAERQAGRVHDALQQRGRETREDLTHGSLLHEVPAAEVERRLAHVRHARGAEGFWLGSAGRVEPHGGGLLDLLLRSWRPGARPARLGDAFPFANGPLALRELYEGHRRQIFLPAAPRLPRMRFVLPDGRGGTRIVERDAFYFLGVLLEREPPASWKNGLGQTLSVDRLLARVLEVHQSEPPVMAGQTDFDHGRLHLVELLLAWHQRSLREGKAAPVEPDAIQQRFLAVDPCAVPAGAQASPALRDGVVECFAHRVESLGRLAAEPGVRWSPAEAAQVVRFLETLEATILRDLDDVRVAHLVHFAIGLDLLREHPPR
ncbi:MAG: hypothetical protein HKP30_07905 [Myxococcales bacterium]|nr:hypothetical protein [Myxococcales bacterium]